MPKNFIFSVLSLVAFSFSGIASAQDLGSEHRPVVSPDGKSIIFMQTLEDGDWELFIMDLNGENSKRLTNHPGWDGYAAFSPDGRFFTYDREDGPAKLPFLYDLEANTSKPFIEMEGVWATVNGWHPTEDKVVMFIERDEKRDLFFATREGGDLTQLTKTPDENEHDAHFSPDGKKLAYAVNTQDGSALRIMDLESGKTHQVVTSTQYLYGLDWSPDSSKIAYTDTPNDNPEGNAELYIYDLENREVNQVTTNEDYDHMPVWLPDGNTLIFTSYKTGVEKIYLLDLETREVQSFSEK